MRDRRLQPRETAVAALDDASYDDDASLDDAASDAAPTENIKSIGSVARKYDDTRAQLDALKAQLDHVDARWSALEDRASSTTPAAAVAEPRQSPVALNIIPRIIHQTW